MFETYETARIHNPFSTPENEEHLWSNVSIRLHTPWLYITYTMKYDDGVKLKNILLLSKIDDLKNINNVEHVQINNVYLVSPEHLNNSPYWLMEPIKKILTGFEPECDQSRYIYILENGNKYFDSGICKKEEELRSIEVLYEK